jgi:hypothetical protein
LSVGIPSSLSTRWVTSSQIASGTAPASTLMSAAIDVPSPITMARE